MIHVLKILPDYYEDVESGLKTIVVVPKDRDFQVGDFIILQEWDGNDYTGRKYICRIADILDDARHCLDGYVVLYIEI